MKKRKSIFLWLLLILGMSSTLLSSCKEDEDEDATIVISSLSLDKTILSLAVGDTYTFTPVITPANATNQTIIWTTSDASIATVDNGVVTAIAVGTTIITANNGTHNVTCVLTVSQNGESSILINGVRWATCNVYKPGTFASSPESSGMFYQWNCKVGWPTTGVIGSITATDGSNTWNNSWNGGLIPDSSSETWASINDPSPKGFRIPTYNEIKTLLDTSKVISTRVALKNISGIKFIDKASGNFIFMPLSGCRTNPGGNVVDASFMGAYWSCTPIGNYYAYVLYFEPSLLTEASAGRSNAQFIRPVVQ